MLHTLQTIGFIESPFQEKFGIPRQPSLAPSVESTLRLIAPFNHPDYVRGLEGFSHLWIEFIFHQTQNRGWQALVRPPRLGGNKKVGVFASRSTHRPNPLGLSLVQLKNIVYQPQETLLILSGADMLNGTPVVDIKPYIAFIESIPHASSAYIDGPPITKNIHWSSIATEQLHHLSSDVHYHTQCINEVLAQSPEPAYQHQEHRVYGMHLFNWNICFKTDTHTIYILEITPT